jgi:hypothetical protein
MDNNEEKKKRIFDFIKKEMLGKADLDNPQYSDGTTASRGLPKLNPNEFDLPPRKDFVPEPPEPADVNEELTRMMRKIDLMEAKLDIILDAIEAMK